MTKEVLISITGLHYEVVPGEEMTEETEPIEVITPAVYYFKNGKHYILYDEIVEGIPGCIKNKVRVSPEEGILELTKSGITRTNMIFEKGKIHMSQYNTPYGELLMGIYTKEMQCHEEERLIKIDASYTLDINGEKVADCEIGIRVRAKGEV